MTEMEPSWWHVVFAFVAGMGLMACFPSMWAWLDRRYVNTQDMYDPEARQ